jgi:DDE domain
LETVVTAKRDKAAPLKFLKQIMKKCGRPRSIVTDGLYSYPAAMKEIGSADRHDIGRRLNNRAENSHQPFRRRERAMQRFRSAKTLQKFSSVHAHVHNNHFNQERHLVAREIYKRETLGRARRVARAHGMMLARNSVLSRQTDAGCNPRFCQTRPARRLARLAELWSGARSAPSSAGRRAL